MKAGLGHWIVVALVVIALALIIASAAGRANVPPEISNTISAIVGGLVGVLTQKHADDKE